jgi:hypothetical protein
MQPEIEIQKEISVLFGRLLEKGIYKRVLEVLKDEPSDSPITKDNLISYFEQKIKYI